MRHWFIVLTLVLASSLLTWGRKEDTLDDLKARVDSANSGERVKLCLQIAKRQLDAADKLYTDGKVDDARTAINDVVSYSEKAGDVATRSGKKVKQAEISIREMAKKLRDLKGTLNFEDQAPVQDAVNHLERVRTNLLASMFGKGNQ